MTNILKIKKEINRLKESLWWRCVALKVIFSFEQQLLADFFWNLILSKDSVKNKYNSVILYKKTKN